MSLQSAQLLLLSVALSLLAPASSQANQGVRLAGSPLGPHAGRVEVKYNGRWGTICDNGWSSYDAAVICKMLNYTDDICAVSSATDVFGEGVGNVWITDLRCGYRDTNLDQCSNSNPRLTNPCDHNEDAALICQDPSIMSVPYDITELNQTTRTIVVGWKLAFIPPYIRGIDFRLNISEVGATSYRTFFYRVSVTDTSREFNYTIRSLSFNTTYNIFIRAEGEYQWCSYNELVGKNSPVYTISTADSVPPSTLRIQLVTQDTPYIGTLQVMHDGEWGNVCDDLFGTDDADVACWSLNYTEGAVCYGTSSFPSTNSAPIWLDNVDCRDADRFEDCAHRGWGVHDCGSSESIGLICNPGPSVVPTVTGVRATAVAPTTIMIQWESIPNIRRYRVQYSLPGSRIYVSYARSVTEWTLRGLVLGGNYSINISAGMEFGSYRGGNCYYKYLYGDYSESLYVVTRESPPTIAVAQFHITVLNSTAVEVTWRPPSSTVGINGDIRGYKIFVDEINGNQTVLDIVGEENRVAFVTDLEPLATYLFSILMYTVGDGPLSVRLQVTMPDEDFVQLITKFGVYGDEVESLTGYTYTRGFNVLCGSDVKDATFYWKFSNGSRIGIANPGFRGAHFVNGTAVLQIGTGLAYTRSLALCDGGVYTCVATHPDGSVTYRNFSLTIGYSQPVLDPPWKIQRGSTWIQIGWDPLACDGGFPLKNYFVEYRTRAYYSSYSSAGVVTGLNYTIRYLSPNNEYEFRVGRETTRSSRTSYSGSISVLTLEAGPSSPRAVSVMAGYNSEVCVTWRPPATPIGTVILYKLYAERVEESGEAFDAVDLPTETVVKTFPGGGRSGCMQLRVTGVIYHFQMSAVAVINGESVEGTLSPFSDQTTVFVPKLGIPVPVDVEASATNTSVTLQWDLPENVQLGDASLRVTYSGVVEWTSPAGVYTSFKEEGMQSTQSMLLTLSPLTPSTEYLFRVGLVTSKGERGEEFPLTVTTANETGEKLAYFQVRIQNIGDCNDWVSEDPEYKISEIKKSLRQRPISLCQCQTTESQLSQAEFSCRTGPPDTAIFRARVLGTPSRSASDMTATIRDWVEAGSGSIKIGTSRFPLDPTCDPSLENIHAPDCIFDKTDATTTPTSKPTASTDTTTPKVTDKQPNRATEGSVGGGDKNDSSSAEVAGILLGGLITGLLIALVVTLVIIIFLWYRKQKAECFKDQSAFNELINQPGDNSSGITEDDKI